MIYFDNAATTFPKPECVIQAVNECLKKYCANPGRSAHNLALLASEKVYETRERIIELLNEKEPENVVFSPNATYALNLAIKGTIKESCHCIISDLEHNSVLRPLYKVAEEYGCDISIYDSSLPPKDAIIPLIRQDTAVVITTAASNVTGRVIDLKEVSKICTKYNLKLIIDASQYLGHFNSDFSQINYHVICSAGHKALFGIQGSGFAVFKSKQNMDTLIEGGSGTDTFSKDMPSFLPERYEAGTLNTPAIISLGSGIDYIEKIGIENIQAHISTLSERILDILLSIPYVKIYGAENGIISFNVGTLRSSVVSEHLNKYNIATRSGFHCAPLIHKKIGTDKIGSVRISLSYMNRIEECDKLYYALRALI